MKICSTCNTKKDFSHFYKNKGTRDGYSYSCKQCSDKSNQGTRYKYQERYNGYRNDFKKKLNEQINYYKSSFGCQHCGENSHPSLLELHHSDPSVKENHPSSMRTSWDRWLTEAQKCIILCCNCHRKVHAGILKI